MESKKCVKFLRNSIGKVDYFQNFILKFPLRVRIPDNNNDGNSIHTLQLNIDRIFITKCTKDPFQKEYFLECPFHIGLQQHIRKHRKYNYVLHYSVKLPTLISECYYSLKYLLPNFFYK